MLLRSFMLTRRLWPRSSAYGSRSSRLIPHTCLNTIRSNRQYCTESGNPTEEEFTEFCKQFKEFDNGDNVIHSTSLLNEDGDVVFTIDRKSLDNPDHDWSAFEAAFGLDKFDNTKEDWKPEVEWDSIEFDQQDIEELDRLLAEAQEKGTFHPDGHTMVQTNNSANAHNSAKTTEGERNATEGEHSTTERKRTRGDFLEGVTTKLHRNRAPTPTDHMQSPWTHPQNTTSALSSLRIPKLPEKPGYERRLRSLEAEMEKIAVDVLCSSDWYAQGADMQKVMLSPNGQLLKVYYSLERGENHDERSFKKLCQRMEKEVRTALAKGLYAKRVPKVLLQLLGHTENVCGSSDGTPSVEDAFALLDAERDDSDSIGKQHENQ